MDNRTSSMEEAENIRSSENDTKEANRKVPNKNDGDMEDHKANVEEPEATGGLKQEDIPPIMTESTDDEGGVDPEVKKRQDIIASQQPRTELEIAQAAELARLKTINERLAAEVSKLKNFISKRKQTYKRKRKESSAPTRPLSAYNIYIKERFKELSKENEAALMSDDADTQLKRVPPASLVASTGNEWKELSAEKKAWYEQKAKADRQRYDEEMATYQPPEKPGSRKRNKTGYNMFFSQHVLNLKQTQGGVPSERGSVARLVGEAWKKLSPEDKQTYEREADQNNQENPIEPKPEGEGDGTDNVHKLPKPHPPSQAGGGSLPHAAPYGAYDGYGVQGGPPQPPPPGGQGRTYSDHGSAPAQDHYAQGMQAAAYSPYGMYGQGHPPPPPQAYGGYPQHGGQADAYGYPPPHYGYPQHPGYGQYQDGSPTDV